MHSKHLVTARKHAIHAVHHRKSATHPVQSRNLSEVNMRPFESLGTVIENMLDFPMAEENLMSVPPVDIRETGKAVEVSMALPGVEKKDITLDLTEDTLAIFCERRDENGEKAAGDYRLNEQSYDRFYRSFTLPAAVKIDDAKAVYRNGELKVTLQKQKQARNRRIKVE